MTNVERELKTRIVIDAKNLTRKFGSVTAVNDVTFAVNNGEIFGFFGPNGAGKTTTIRLLCGLLKPSSGSAVVAGLDVTRDPTGARGNLAILPEEVSYYEKMTPAKYLRFFSKMAGYKGSKAKARVEEVAGIAEMGSFMNKRIATLSHGQRQKVSLARTFLSDAPIMFLDEPFTGIDIIHRKALRKYLRDYVARGNCVFFTSHNLIEAEHIVDRFAFIDAGRILKIGTARELRDKFLMPSYALRVSDLEKARKVLADRLKTTECRIEGEELLVTLQDGKDVSKISSILGEAQITLSEMRQLGTMEEVFLAMKKGAGE